VAEGETGPLPPAVILGGAVTALSVARSLTDAGISVYVLDHRASPVRLSRRRACFVEVDGDEMQPRMMEWLRSGPRGAVVLACSDEGLELIARNRAELLDLGYLPMEADDEVLLAMLDKGLTDTLAREHGIPVPRVLALRNHSDIETVGREFDYPCVLKPVHSHLFASRTKSSAKVLFVQSPAALRAEFERMSSMGVKMLVIEVISGPDDEYVSYYSYLDELGQPLLQLTKRKIRQLPTRFGCGTYHATTHDPEVAELGLRFFQAVGLRGLGNVEFKRDGRDGRLKLIECNPRFTMSNELIRLAGIDLALFSYSRLLGRATPPVAVYRDDMRLWDPVRDALAFLEYRRKGELSLGRWIGSLNHPQHFPSGRIDDPLPALASTARLLSRAQRNVASAARALGATPPVAERLTERLTRAGRAGYMLASRLDLARSAGAGYTWRRLRAKRHFAGIGEQVRHEVYERIWLEAADALGADIEQLAPGLFELSRDGVSTKVFDQMVPLDDAVTLRVALEKPLVHRMLRAEGLPIPDHLEFGARDLTPALEFLAGVGAPCVVKPAAGTGGGFGTTTGVLRAPQLMRARLAAAAASERLLIERQSPGAVFRMLLLDGELLDVVRSLPPRLIGDGQRTIEALIAAENQLRVAASGAAGLSLLGVNLDVLIALEEAGLRLNSIVPAGQSIALGSVTNVNAAADNESFRGDIAPELIEAARRAQKAVGLRLAGVDLITTDPSRPLAETGGLINEVNGTPALHKHYLVADPDGATRVAISVLDRLLSGEVASGAGWSVSPRAV
jgi:D-aspartate ligase